MFICEKCHKRDARVTKCDEDYDKHLVSVIGHCDICGEHSIDLRWCMAYKRKQKVHNQQLCDY